MHICYNLGMGAASGTAGGSAFGAIAGGLLGSVIPGVGTGLGAGLGATIFGGAGGAIGSNQETKKIQGKNNALKDAQAQEAHRLQEEMARKPKMVAPDDFLANKSKQLQNMRLGLAQTITGASSAPAPVLSTPALSGTGKNKLGA